MYVNNVFSTFPPPPGGTASNILYIGIIGPQFCQLLGRAYCGTLWLAIALGGNPNHYFFVPPELHLFSYFLLSLPYRV
jgi:hypothetical protein